MMIIFSHKKGTLMTLIKVTPVVIVSLWPEQVAVVRTKQISVKDKLKGPNLIKPLESYKKLFNSHGGIF